MAALEPVFVVKHTFLEVSLPSPRGRCRSMSDTTGLTAKLYFQESAADDVSTRAGSEEEDTGSICSSKVASWADESDESVDGDSDFKTTVMFRNVPYNCTRDDLIGIMDAHGYRGLYDFVYAPADFRTKSGFGYAFINLVTNMVAREFTEHFNGFNAWPSAAAKVAEVGWSEPNQGLELHVERYRNSPVMHDGVPDEFKPALFHKGERIAFPVPTKAIRAPRFKRR